MAVIAEADFGYLHGIFGGLTIVVILYTLITPTRPALFVFTCHVSDGPVSRPKPWPKLPRVELTYSTPRLMANPTASLSWLFICRLMAIFHARRARMKSTMAE